MTPVDLFGGNSERGMRLSEWLDVMCLGCKHELVKHRAEGSDAGKRRGPRVTGMDSLFELEVTA
jgi:hypothetical protein